MVRLLPARRRTPCPGMFWRVGGPGEPAAADLHLRGGPAAHRPACRAGHRHCGGGHRGPAGCAAGAAGWYGSGLGSAGGGGCAGQQFLAALQSGTGGCGRASAQPQARRADTTHRAAHASGQESEQHPERPRPALCRLRRDGPHRGGRHGQRLPRPPQKRQPDRGAQGAAGKVPGRRQIREALLPRGRGLKTLLACQHRAGLRLQGSGRGTLHRHGIPRWRELGSSTRRASDDFFRVYSGDSHPERRTAPYSRPERGSP